MGSVGNKYRVHEVAKDFGVPTKQITEILTKYAETPKNHMQVLEDRELSLIFEYLTQHNQVSGIQVIFAEGPSLPRRSSSLPPSPPRRSRRARGRAVLPSRRPSPSPVCLRPRWWTPARPRR